MGMVRMNICIYVCMYTQTSCIHAQTYMYCVYMHMSYALCASAVSPLPQYTFIWYIHIIQAQVMEYI